jgi:hypothetical protein
MEKKEKPLEKMTAKELREVALEIPEIEGVHAMKKEELLEAIRKSGGVEKEEAKEEVREVKEEVKGEAKEEVREVKEEVKGEAKEEAEKKEKEEKEEAKKKEQEAKKKEKEEKEEAKKKEKKEERVEKKAGVHVAEFKKRIREFKVLKAEAVEKGDVRMAKIYKRRINRLKKRTRKAA